MTDCRCLKKVQAFSKNSCFDSQLHHETMKHSHYTLKKNPLVKSNFEVSAEEQRLKFKTIKINIADSSGRILWKPINFSDNIPKYIYMFSQLCLCSAKWICFYCQSFQIWLLTRWAVGLVVVGSVGKRSVVVWSVVWWYVDLIKPVWGSEFTCAL